jgi:large subunit ribosomal protein L24
MKQKFSKAWKESKQPRKQRKFLANAPIHIKRKTLGVHLSKELRKKYSRRNIVVRKGDTVLIMRGKFKGKRGKVIKIKIKKPLVNVEGIQVKKRDGSKVNVKLQPSNLQIIELNLEDKKRLGQKEEITKKEKVKEKQIKEKTKESTKSSTSPKQSKDSSVKEKKK